MQDKEETAGFVWLHINYSMVQLLPATGYSVCGYGYGVGKPNPWYTCVQHHMTHLSDNGKTVTK